LLYYNFLITPIIIIGLRPGELSFLFVWLSKNIFSLQDSFALIGISLFLLIFGNLGLAYWHLDIARCKACGTWFPWLQRFRILELLRLRFNYTLQVLYILFDWNQVQLD
jgi:hypothetical protein